MQLLRFLMCFTILKCVVKFSIGASCKGLFCRPSSGSNSVISLSSNQTPNATALRSPHKPENKISFQGITDSRKLNKNCCYNGGTCFLGTFCICPKQFTGRYCEYEKWPQHCSGGILNGEWVVKGCTICRCFSGQLQCLPPIPECEEEPEAFRSAGTALHQNWISFWLLLILLLLTVFFHLPRR